MLDFGEVLQFIFIGILPPQFFNPDAIFHRHFKDHAQARVDLPAPVRMRRLQRSNRIGLGDLAGVQTIGRQCAEDGGCR